MTTISNVLETSSTRSTPARLAALVLLCVVGIVLFPAWSPGMSALAPTAGPAAAPFRSLIATGATVLPVTFVIALLASDGSVLGRPRFTVPIRAVLLFVGSFLVGVAILAAGGIGIYAPSTPARVFGYLLTVPLAEELFFRGAIYQLIAERGSTYRSHVVAIWMSSTVFALAHFGGYHYQLSVAAVRHVVLVFPLGLALGWLRARSGSIWPSVATHAATNLVWLLL